MYCKCKRFFFKLQLVLNVRHFCILRIIPQALIFLLWTYGNYKMNDVNSYDNDVFYCIKDAVLRLKAVANEISLQGVSYNSIKVGQLGNFSY